MKNDDFQRLFSDLNEIFGEKGIVKKELAELEVSLYSLSQVIQKRSGKESIENTKQNAFIQGIKDFGKGFSNGLFGLGYNGPKDNLESTKVKPIEAKTNKLDNENTDRNTLLSDMVGVLIDLKDDKTQSKIYSEMAELRKTIESLKNKTPKTIEPNIEAEKQEDREKLAEAIARRLSEMISEGGKKKEPPAPPTSTPGTPPPPPVSAPPQKPAPGGPPKPVAPPTTPPAAAAPKPVAEPVSVKPNTKIVPPPDNGYTYQAPVSGVVTSTMGKRTSPGGVGSTDHKGIDIAAPIGTPVNSIAPGRVIQVVKGSKSAGNYVVVAHGDTISKYMHLSSVSVEEGQDLAAGDSVGKVGNTGHSTGPHLHLQVEDKQGNIIDPAKLQGLKIEKGKPIGSIASANIEKTKPNKNEEQLASLSADYRDMKREDAAQSQSVVIITNNSTVNNKTSISSPNTKLEKANPWLKAKMKQDDPELYARR